MKRNALHEFVDEVFEQISSTTEPIIQIRRTPAVKAAVHINNWLEGASRGGSRGRKPGAKSKPGRKITRNTKKAVYDRIWRRNKRAEDVSKKII